MKRWLLIPLLAYSLYGITARVPDILERVYQAPDKRAYVIQYQLRPLGPAHVVVYQIVGDTLRWVGELDVQYLEEGLEPWTKRAIRERRFMKKK